MTQEVLKLALEALETELSIDWTNNDEFNASAEKMYEAITAIKEVLAEHAMREVQRLGQEIEQDADSFCDANCVWTDHHPDCKLAQPEQEPKIGCVNHDCDKCKAQPEQEPVTCKTLCELCVKRGYAFCANAVKTTPITAPPQRKPLTYCQECMRPNPIDGSDCAHGVKEST